MVSDDVRIDFVDRPDLTWSFADSITSVSVESKAVCKVELCSVRWIRPQPGTNVFSGKQYPVCRLAMALNTMVDLHKRLTDILQQLESEGIVNRAERPTHPHLVN
jgi:hypothetical protein